MRVAAARVPVLEWASARVVAEEKRQERAARAARELSGLPPVEAGEFLRIMFSKVPEYYTVHSNNSQWAGVHSTQ